MNIARMGTVLLASVSISVLAWAQTDAPKEGAAPAQAPAQAPAPASDQKSAPIDPAQLVIGQNLKVGLPVADAFKLLGVPQEFFVVRGPLPDGDSVAVKYPAYGLTLHFMSGKGAVEGIEMNAKFAGSLDKEVKIGAPLSELVEKYGVPESLSGDIVRYPKTGSYFILGDGKVAEAKMFAPETKLVANRLVQASRR